MRKYFMAFVDLSEIANVTADAEQLDKARERMTELGLLTEKGNPSPAQIGNLVSSVAPPFFDKLKRRLVRRRGGIAAVRETLQKLADKQEYTAMFLYLSIQYGFLEWQVPEGLLLLPAAPDALKVCMVKFMEAFDGFLTAQESEAEPVDDESENM